MYTLYFCQTLISAHIQGLTEEQFQQKSSRGLDVPSVRISKSYASVRRQGDGGSSNLISFPALSVRDPEELAPDFSQVNQKHVSKN